MSPAPPAPALRPRATPGVSLRRLEQLAGSTLPTPFAGPGGAAEQEGPLVTGATLDSRLVRPGDLYVALAGRTQHGARFGPAAAAAGAVAVLTDGAGADLLAGLGAPLLVVPDPRAVMGELAAEVYGRPSTAMTMLGVTGTNGKTTTSYLLEAALRGVGRRPGLIGTIGFRLDGRTLEAPRTTVTTPESPELQALLAVMLEGGADTCVMEVSSHALVLGRTDAITFDVAGFTNLGYDHLDFHGTEESYFEAKARLFTPGRTRSAVINVDDARGRVLMTRLAAAAVPAVGVSLTDPEADYQVARWALGPDGLTEVSLRTPERSVEFRLGLPGDFNVRNAATALAMVDLCGLDLDRAAAALADAEVPGRMQRVDLGPDAPTVFVDFAHTPQAVAAALAAVVGPALATESGPGRRRVVVLGCGGDRDPDKRGPMGAAAAGGADLVVVTDDNPRSEEPAAIRRQVLEGARAAQQQGRSVLVLDGGDRRAAIRLALDRAQAGDVVLVLGKGHETGQQIGAEVLPFNDVEVVREEWARLAPAGGPCRRGPGPARP